MKYLVFLFLLLSLFSKAQDTDEVISSIFGFKTSTPRSEYTRFHLTSSLMFTTGMTVATRDILTNNPQHFFARFPKASKQFWWTRISWKNKYKNGDPAQGKAFPLSTTALVGFTDGWHLMNTFTHVQVGAVFSLAVFSKDYYKIKPWQALSRIAYQSGMYYLGYNFMDRIVFKHY